MDFTPRSGADGSHWSFVLYEYGVQRSMVCILLFRSPSYLGARGGGHGLSLILEVSDLTRLASQCVTVILLSPLPSARITGPRHHTRLLIMQCLGI